MGAPTDRKVGDIYKIIPDGDRLDDHLAEILSVARDHHCSMLVLTGERAGERHSGWPFENFLVVTPLELLAKQAE